MFKRFVLFIFALFICSIAFAQTIRWHVGDSVYTTTTCSSGDSITPPTAPAKTGYNFVKWKLPYTEIEYLESTGTQWIDTNVIVLENEKALIKYKYSGTPSTNDEGRWFAGAFADNSARFHAGWYYGSWFKWDGFTYVSEGEDLYTANGIAEMDGTINFYLFATNGISTKLPIKMYYAKIFSINDTLIRDFIPVLDKDGIPCMYDKVTRQFFYNQGTGDFIAGPVINE